jgi:hypothetical protein
VTVKNGQATIRLPKLATGTWKIKAVYRQSANFTTASKTTTVHVKTRRTR